MAGEMEEPISFRADSIHSGSISFGRFETEPLSWERRSSFSHNRYLEEVGKYSTPGSVTQKKAYFEAHFKKKALLHQTSTEGQNDVEYQQNGVKYDTSEKDILDHMNSMEEFEHAKVGSQSIHFDVSPHGSDCQGEFHEMQHERECNGVSYPEFDTNFTSTLTNDDLVSNGDHHDYALDAVLNSDNQDDVLPTTNNGTMFNCDLQDDALTPPFDDEVLYGNLQDVEPDEMHQTRFECSLVPSVKKDQPEARLKDKLADETKNMETLPRIRSAPKKHVALIDGLKNSQRQTQQVKTRTETKTVKTTLMAQVPRKISNEAPKESRKNPRSMETLMRAKTENSSTAKTSKITAKTSKTASSLARISKPVDPKNLRTKLGQDCRSEKYLKAKKPGTESQASTMEKSESRARQSMDRHKRTVNSMKSDLKPPSVIFHLKSDEKAAKRKEVEPGNVKSTKSQSQSRSPGCIVEHRLPRSSMVSVSESQNSASQLKTDSRSVMASELSESTGTSTNKNCTLKVFKRSDSMGKNSIGNGKNCKQLSGDSKLKEERIEGRQVVGAVARSSGKLAMKGVGCKNVDGDTGMHHLVVGIPS